jgi:hypothetical protein
VVPRTFEFLVAAAKCDERCFWYNLEKLLEIYSTTWYDIGIPFSQPNDCQFPRQERRDAKEWVIRNWKRRYCHE